MNASGRRAVIAAVSLALALAVVTFGMLPPAPTEAEVAAAMEALFKPLPFTPGEFGNASSTGAAMSADGSLSPEARAAAEAGTRAEDAAVAARLSAAPDGAIDAETHLTLVRMVAQRTDRTDGEAARQVDQVMRDLKMKAQATRAGRLKLALPAGLVVLLAGGLAAWATRRS